MTSLDLGRLEITEAEQDEEQEGTHWSHPIDPTVHWCGTPRKTFGFSFDRLGDGPRSCPFCEELYQRLGSRWWWDTHIRYYQSQCSGLYGVLVHNCAAA